MISVSHSWLSTRYLVSTEFFLAFQRQRNTLDRNENMNYSVAYCSQLFTLFHWWMREITCSLPTPRAGKICFFPLPSVGTHDLLRLTAKWKKTYRRWLVLEKGNRKRYECWDSVKLKRKRSIYCQKCRERENGGKRGGKVTRAGAESGKTGKPLSAQNTAKRRHSVAQTLLR